MNVCPFAIKRPSRVRFSTKRERGSVLVLTLGLLVVLALMATAFISTVQLYRDVGRNAQATAIARLMAAKGVGKAVGENYSTNLLSKTFEAGGTDYKAGYEVKAGSEGGSHYVSHGIVRVDGSSGDSGIIARVSCEFYDLDATDTADVKWQWMGSNHPY